MLKLSWIEIFTRLIPEMLLIIWGISVIAKESLSFKKHICISTIMALLVYCVRLLPIYFGVHMIISIVLIISILATIGVPVIKAIYSTLFVYFLLNLSEFFNALLLKFFNIQANFQSSDAIMRSASGIPSLIFFALFIIIIKQKEGLRNVFNRKHSN